MHALRKCTGNKDRSVLTASPSRANQEDDVLAALERILNASEIFRRIHQLLVDFEDDVAIATADGPLVVVH